MPLRCHFLHFEITVSGKSGVFNRQWLLGPIGPYYISALPHPKLWQAHAWMPKGQKWLRNHRKTEKNRAKKDWLNNKNIIFLELCQLVNTELENQPSSHLTKHTTPACGKKLRSSKELAWNLYTIWHKILEKTKQANSSSFSTYFMISVTDANLLTHAQM